MPCDAWALLLDKQGIYFWNDGGSLSVAQVKIDPSGDAHVDINFDTIRYETQYLAVDGSLVEIAPSSVEASKLIYWN